MLYNKKVLYWWGETLQKNLIFEWPVTLVKNGEKRKENWREKLKKRIIEYLQKVLILYIFFFGGGEDISSSPNLISSSGFLSHLSSWGDITWKRHSLFFFFLRQTICMGHRSPLSLKVYATFVYPFMQKM